MQALNIEKLYAGALPLPEGWTQSDHGAIPLPAPATLQILAAATTRPAPGTAELVTPTGAALLAELARFEQPPMRLAKLGTGAGTNDFDWPNIARLWLGEPEQTDTSLIKLATNIDDMSPELYAPACRSLENAGALDVWLTPVQMKKQRPGVVLSVLAPADREAELAHILLRETTTLGVRVEPVHHRYVAQRQIRPVQTTYGTVRVKTKMLDGQAIGVMPEYEDCVQCARQHNVPTRDVYETAIQTACNS